VIPESEGPPRDAILGRHPPLAPLSQIPIPELTRPLRSHRPMPPTVTRRWTGSPALSDDHLNMTLPPTIARRGAV
jgi:hypothetical protein